MMSGVEERWVGSPSKSFHFVMFTSVHARKKKKKKVMVTEGKHHKTWHTRTSARGGFRVIHTHTVRLRG